jgi:predicted amidophosphoribosyltransferase
MHDCGVKILSSLNDLLFPQRCMGCGALEVDLCPSCSLELQFRKIVTHLPISHALPLKIISSVEYSPISSKILLSSKESQLKLADRFLLEAIHESLSYFLATEWADILIPIPSRRKNTRKRGRDYMSTLTSLTSQRTGIPHYNLLSHNRPVLDQSGLHHRQRRNNLGGAMVVDSRVRVGAGARAILIDDLVTTGATLVEAARALRYAGIEVIGGVTAFVAKPLR